MSTDGKTEKKEFCTQIRTQINVRVRPRQLNNRVDDTSLPDQESLAMMQRVLKLRQSIEDLEQYAPDKTPTLRQRLMIVERSVSGGNASTAEGPLGQLEDVTEQLLLQHRPTRTRSGGEQTRQPPVLRQNVPPQQPNQPQLPQRPNRPPPVPTPQHQFTAAATQIDLLKNQVPDQALTQRITQRVNQQKTVKTQELKNLVKDAGENQDENIRRKVALIFDSKDAKYIDNVQKPCDSTLLAIGTQLEKGTSVTPNLTKRLEILVPQLEQWRLHYADKTGITDQKLLNQRDAKVSAILKRKQAIEAVLTKVGEIGSLQENEEANERAGRKLQMQNDGSLATVTQLLANFDQMMTTDAHAAQEALKNLAKYLGKADAVTRQVVIAEMPDIKKIIPLIKEADSTDTDKFIADLMKVKGADRTVISQLCDEATTSELSVATSKGTMLRGTSTASKLTTACGKTGPSKNFLDRAVNGSMSGVLESKADLDVSGQNTITPPNGDRVSNPNVKAWSEYDKKWEQFNKKHAKAIQAHKELVRNSVDQVTQLPVPDELAEICGTMYNDALKRYKELKQPPGGDLTAEDEEDALAIVGGHIMLRLVNPAMTTASTDPSLTQQQKDAIVLQSKLLQHISNGTSPSGKGNSPAFDELVSNGNNPSPEAAKMQAFFKATAMKGRRVKANKQVTLDRILNSPQALALLKQFMQGKQCAEVVEFWELAHAGVPANPQHVYDTYINGQKMINIDNKHDFDTVNSQLPKNWANAPWGGAVTFVHDLMRDDTMRKLATDPMWDRVYPIFGI